MIESLLKPFYEIVTAPPLQWHPMLVHFPIAFLIVEAVLLGLWRMTGKAEYDRFAYGFLLASLWTLLIVAGAGVHDAGLGSGSPFWHGLQHRWANAFEWQSPLTVHAWLALGLVVLTTARLLWRKFGGTAVLRGGQGWAYGLITAFGLWLLATAAHVGGLMSHT